MPSVHFDGDALAHVLSTAAKLEGTPLGEAALRSLESIGDCETAFGVARADGSGVPALPTLDCLDGVSERDRRHTEWASARRGSAAGWMTWPLGTDGHVEARFDLDASGNLVATGRVTPPGDRSVLAMFWPDEAAPAASVLDASRVLVHAHAHPEAGLGLARFLPEGGQADQLFALKGRLLEGALLTGTWEFAFVTPSDDGVRPLPVAALHHRGAAPIRAALDEALTQLEATWPIERSPHPFALADGVVIEGGCYADLPLLPELSPCWAVTETAVLIGYRAAAVDAAMGRPHVASAPIPAAPSGTRFAIDLQGLDRLDRRAEADPPGITPGSLFERLELELTHVDEGGFDLSARLDRTPTARSGREAR